MKYRIIIVYVFSIFSINAFCINHYTGKTHVESSGVKYSVVETDSGRIKSVTLENESNVFSGQRPYDVANDMPYTDANHPMPIAGLSYKTLDEILHSVFSSSELKAYFNDNCRLFVTFRINPNTCLAGEMQFHLHYTATNKEILSLPVRKIVQLESALKSRMVFVIPDKGKDANFLILSGRFI